MLLELAPAICLRREVLRMGPFRRFFRVHQAIPGCHYNSSPAVPRIWRQQRGDFTKCVHRRTCAPTKTVTVVLFMRSISGAHLRDATPWMPRLLCVALVEDVRIKKNSISCVMGATMIKAHIGKISQRPESRLLSFVTAQGKPKQPSSWRELRC